MAEIRINATGGVKFFDADDSHYAQILAGTISSNIDVLTLGSSSADFNIPVKVLGTTPTLTIGDAGAEDTAIVFDGNAQDFYIGLDDSADDLVIGLGSTVGTTPSISINEDRDVTISDGAIDFDIASHDTSNGLKLGGTLVTATAAELNIMDGVTSTASEINLIDGGTSRGTTAVASGDGILINDGGTMRMTNVDTVSTYFASHSVGGTNIATVGTIGTGTWQGTAIASGYIAADAITGAKIADDAIDSEHYTDGSIDNAHIADNAIDSEHYADGSIDNAHIADDQIDSEHYVDGSIDTAHLAADAVTGAKIADDAIDSEHYTDGSIDNAHIADNAIDSEHYADGSIDNAHIADDAIDSEHYAAGSIDTAHIADDQITLAKMASGTDGNIISYDASGNPVAIATGNDGQILTSTGAGSPPAFEDAAGGGKVLQVVSTSCASQGLSHDGGNYTERSTNLTVNITPAATSSKILVIVNTIIGCGSGNIVRGYLKRDSTNIGAAPFWQFNGNSLVRGHDAHCAYLDSPSSTSQIAYNITVSTNSGANNFGIGKNTSGNEITHSNITVIEIGA